MNRSPAELRKTVLAIRSPGGEEPTERIALRYPFMATVTGTAAAPARVTVDRHGVTLEARYFSWYTPTVADLVLCEYVGEDVVCWGDFA